MALDAESVDAAELDTSFMLAMGWADSAFYADSQEAVGEIGGAAFFSFFSEKR